VPSEQVQHDAAASQFVATLGAAMAAANYPVAMVRGVTEQTSRADGLDHQFLALPNYVRVGSPTGEAMYIANPDFDVRYDQSFPLAQLVARAPAGAISREEDMAELEPIRNQRRRFPPWVTVLGYAVQSTGLALILQPTPWSLVGAASLGLLVGALSVRGRRIDAIGYLLPTICSFLVALIVFTFNNHSHVGVEVLRALAAHHVAVGRKRALRGFHADRSVGIRHSDRRPGGRNRRHQPRHHRDQPAGPVGAAARRDGVRARSHAVFRAADVVFCRGYC
jgi:uncharacterized membrane protein YjjP (DUF1212 family)